MIDTASIFSRFLPLQTERLVLRELSLDDLPDIAKMNRDEKILKHMHYGVRYDAFDTLTHSYALFNTKQAITWGIALRENDRLIGIRTCFIDSDNEPVTIQGQLQSEHRKKGYTFEAYSEIIRYLQKNGVEYIKANAEKSNLAAISLLEKLGFQRPQSSLFNYSFLDPNPSAILFEKNIKPIINTIKPKTSLGFKLSAMFAKTYIENQEFTKASASIDSLIAQCKNDNEFAEAFLLRGIVLRNTKGNLAAMDSLFQSAQLNPSLSQSYVELGICQYNLSMRSDAHESWQTAANLGDERAATLIEKYPE